MEDQSKLVGIFERDYAREVSRIKNKASRTLSVSEVND